MTALRRKEKGENIKAEKGVGELRGGNLPRLMAHEARHPSNPRSIEQPYWMYAQGRGRKKKKVEGDQQANDDRSKLIKGGRGA